jgi:hypothetical protein
MMRSTSGAIVAAIFSAAAVCQAQQHADCTYVIASREQAEARSPSHRSRLTEDVVRRLPPVSPTTRGRNADQQDNRGIVDQYLFADMQASGVTPADRTSDFEFIRRVTLDLTGRIPTVDRLLAFIADTSPNKRAALVDNLVSRPEWIDKWTMYFGDLYRNSSVTLYGINRSAPGRNAFYQWIKTALTENRPYDQIARGLIAARGDRPYDPQQGAINWLVGGIVSGGPQQDIWDQQAAGVAETFLGMSHMNCILCHNGRGHLDQLSLWGKSALRTDAWGLASFLSHSIERPMAVGWSIEDDTIYVDDYYVVTTTGNRPARLPAGKLFNIAPVYPFSGRGPQPGENYRAALAREVTSDFQFPRATVNYIWKEFFSRGLVEPANQFDPARLDPDNPPPDPWTLQPSNARLLNALAQEFIDGGFNLKALMSEIVNSDAYQLSARYNGQWNPAWEPLFARKLARRLWAEEIHDAVAQSSNVVPSYTIGNFSAAISPPSIGSFALPTFGRVSSAMQFPETAGTPSDDPTIAFLDTFLRGNRKDQLRESVESAQQALNLMNGDFVLSRIKAGQPGSLLQPQTLSLSDKDFVEKLFLTVLSRYPTDAEAKSATVYLQSFARTGTRAAKAENLLWSLYNKVDFVFNY